MKAPVIRLVGSRGLSDERLERLYRKEQAAQVTYGHVGSTFAPDRWPNRLPRRFLRQIGSGPAAFEAGRQALRTWVPQLGIGARIYPADVPVAVGSTVLIVLPFGPVAIIAPTRVLDVVDEPATFGFAYGTLPGHPENGEESFLVRLRPDGTVLAEVSVDATPATLAVRIGAPIAGLLQRRAIEGYLEALAGAAEPS